jgi:predicted  nucleic acid-binding Zn-ribbon protein
LCRAEKEALSNELNDLREMMAAEANSRAALQDTLAAAERQLGEARNELDMTKAVRTGNKTSHPSSRLTSPSPHLTSTLPPQLLTARTGWCACLAVAASRLCSVFALAQQLKPAFSCT